MGVGKIGADLSAAASKIGMGPGALKHAKIVGATVAVAGGTGIGVGYVTDKVVKNHNPKNAQTAANVGIATGVVTAVSVGAPHLLKVYDVADRYARRAGTGMYDPKATGAQAEQYRAALWAQANPKADAELKAVAHGDAENVPPTFEGVLATKVPYLHSESGDAARPPMARPTTVTIGELLKTKALGADGKATPGTASDEAIAHAKHRYEYHLRHQPESASAIWHNMKSAFGKGLATFADPTELARATANTLPYSIPAALAIGGVSYMLGSRRQQGSNAQPQPIYASNMLANNFPVTIPGF